MQATNVFHWRLKYVSLIKLYWAEVITLESSGLQHAGPLEFHLFPSEYKKFDFSSFVGGFNDIVSRVGLCWVNHPHGSSHTLLLCASVWCIFDINCMYRTSFSLFTSSALTSASRISHYFWKALLEIIIVIRIPPYWMNLLDPELMIMRKKIWNMKVSSF